LAGHLIDSLRSFYRVLPAALMEGEAEQPVIRQLAIEDCRLAAEILAVQKRAYRAEARIIGYDRIPALEDTVESLRYSGETFYGLYGAGRLSAVVSVVAEGSILTICRLVVEPAAHRRGMASDLLTYLNRRYRGVTVIRASTAARNNPALQFYKAHRFRETRRWKTEDGLELVELECRRSEGTRL
jgi:ribosomal protein S18 acetylase RimI-like enzyme